MSREDAEAFVPPAKQSAACISITDPGQRPARLSSLFRAVLRLSFHDLAEPLPPGTLVDEGRPAILIGPEHAGEIVRFAAKHQHVDLLVVHCEAGVSRSVSIAEALYDVFDHRAPNRLVYDEIRSAYRRNWEALGEARWIKFGAPRRIRGSA